MDPLSPPIERAIGALSEGSGRTIAIAGPPLSGKSRLLDSIREELTRREWRVFELQGIYRDRETPYAALANFGVDPGLSPATAIPPDTSGGLAASWLGAPMAPFSRVRSGDGRRRRRGGSDPSARIGGGGGGPPRRGGRVVDGPEVHSGLVRAVSEGTRPVALVIEDATLFDTESRNAIIHLCQRVRFRPILVVLALDVSLPAYGPWEDALQKCGGVEWVRILHPRPDPLEESRFRETFEALPEATRTALVVTAILGGSVSDVRLVRATRMSLAELANALAPALEANMVRVGGGRVTVSHAAWIDLLPSLAPQDVRQRIHREIAEALSALDPEPDLKHGLDLAEHLFEASHDHVALRHLLELSARYERAADFETTARLLSKALECIPSLPAAERPGAEADIRAARARALFFGGRPDLAETEIRAGISVALQELVDPEWVEELVERLQPALRAAGPRNSLTLLLDELVGLFARADAPAAQVLLQAIMAEHEVDRGRMRIAMSEAGRAARLARRLGPEVARNAWALVDAISFELEGVLESTRNAESAPSATLAFGQLGSGGLQQAAEELQLRFIRRRLQPEEALKAHLTAIPVLERMGSLVNELYHVIDLAEMALDSKPGPRAREAVDRARHLVELLHLIPPSPLVFRLWVLEGRLAASEGRLADARDIWSAIGTRPGPAVLPPAQAEALLRLALLELSEGHPAQARPLLERLDAPDFAGKFPNRWVRAIVDVALAADGSAKGSGPLPTHP